MSVIEKILKYVGYVPRPNNPRTSQEVFKTATSISSEEEVVITPSLIASTYTENPIARRLVNDLTLDVIKAGFDFECNVENAKEIKLAKSFEEFYLPELRTLLQIQAVYGSALIVVETENTKLEDELQSTDTNFKFKIYPPYHDKSFLFNAQFGFEVEKIDEITGDFTYYNLLNITKTNQKKVHKSRCIHYRAEGLFLDDLPNGMLYPIVKNILNHSSYLAMELKTAKRGTLTMVSVNNEKIINNGIFPYFHKPSIKDFQDSDEGTQIRMRDGFESTVKTKNEALQTFAKQLVKAKNGDILTADDCFKIESQNILVNDFSRQIAKEEDMIAIGSGFPFTILLGKHSGNFGSGGSGSDNSYSQMYRSKIFAEQEIFKIFLTNVLKLYFKLNGISSPVDFKIRMKSPYPETAMETAQRKKLETENTNAEFEAYGRALENPTLDYKKVADRLGIKEMVNEEELKLWQASKDDDTVDDLIEE